MFDFADKAKIWIPVRWRGLKAGEGDVAEEVENEIEVLVEIVDRDKLPWNDVSLAEGINEAEGEEKESLLLEREMMVFKAVSHAWRGVNDKGVPVPFTDDNIKRMLRLPMFGAGFETSYSLAWAGRVEHREKNSESSPDGGRAEGADRSKKPTTRKAKPSV